LNTESDDRNHYKQIQVLVERYEKCLKEGTSSYFEVDQFTSIIEYYQQFGSLDHALNVANAALEMHPFTSLLLLKKAQVHIDLNQNKLAEEFVEKAVAINGRDVDSTIVEIQILVAQEKFEIAEQMIFDIMEKVEEEEKVELYYELSDLYEIWGKFDEELNCLSKLCFSTQSDSDALKRTIMFIDFHNRHKDGIKLFKSLIEENAYNHLAWHNLGLCYMGLELFEKALDAFSYSIAIKDDFEPSIRESAEAHFELANFQKALEFYLESAALSSYADESLYYSLGYTHYHLNNFQKAIFYLKKAIEIDDTYDDAYHLLGKVYQARGSLKKALSNYHKAIQMNEDNPEYLESFAVLSFKTENPQTAVEYFLKAIEAAPQNINMWIKLSKCYYELDYFSESYDVIHQALDVFENEVDLLYIGALSLYKLGKIQSSNEMLTLALTSDYQAHTILYDWDEKLITKNGIMTLIDQYRNMSL